MRMILIAVMMACAAPVSAQPVANSSIAAEAVEQARLTASRQLLDLLHIERTYDQMFTPLMPLFAKAVIGMMQNDSKTRDAVTALIQKGEGGQDRLVAILSQEFFRSLRIRYPEMKEAAAAEYAKRFTEPELRDLIAFYSSGTGSKALQVLPELQKSIMATGQEVGRKAGEEAGRHAFERALREMLPSGKSTSS